ncbi:adenosylcobinamide kinase /adenosylcobinamide-phosphate guanylyltransferase [Marinobacter daqiaonensis]|uniref:Bifunctional adenosylcobalamin biosynthesis protein n=1 Tax=Marinobacter daqiaonensis TaxID=650891 RepID=A0A1I6JN93_9GAMM|nr:bifunctional adenosylcobinamide kinase/adenosylcobinamide-phosphate guanylyltransferase [Marinobacter daqiaonensis]SFR80448.1 adenosylcobinamide kinase /adenosylcobinamide-phosphate guanylyltransferase [Marinobacter daqiaonensis]
MSKTAKHTLVLGGIRSGKSALAERLAADAGPRVVYLATATAGDGEMAKRIARHREQRPREWGLVEEPLDLAGAIGAQGGQSPAPCLLVDCMSLWLSNLLHEGEAVFASHRKAFLESLLEYPGPMVIVSNEVGLGTIGMDPLTRRFCDELGWLNQTLARQCDRVLMSVAGLPLTLK